MTEAVKNALEIGRAYVMERVNADGGIDYCDIELRSDVEAIDEALKEITVPDQPADDLLKTANFMLSQYQKGFGLSPKDVLELLRDDLAQRSVSAQTPTECDLRDKIKKLEDHRDALKVMLDVATKSRDEEAKLRIGYCEDAATYREKYKQAVEEAISKVPFFKEIDLTKTDKRTHPDIIPGKMYLVKFYNSWHFGPFTKEWYGLNFSRWGASGCQFDAPGSSSWERVIEVNIEALEVK